ncbi:hypothetical protein L1856_25455 [Streptomyces sp. Tue 6430]|nr:hypothetical protein [Streptomyces sp. Tue 6430]
MTATKAVTTRAVDHDARREAFAEVSRFRAEFHACLTPRGDALFESCDALSCTDGPVRALVAPALAPGCRRGHGVIPFPGRKGITGVPRASLIHRPIDERDRPLGLVAGADACA